MVAVVPGKVNVALKKTAQMCFLILSTMKGNVMIRNDNLFRIEVKDTQNRCPIGETVGEKNIAQGKIPVLSREGARLNGSLLPDRQLTAFLPISKTKVCDNLI